MQTLRASDVRQNWSSVVDSVVRQKPAFIRRTRDDMVLCTTETLSQLVENIRFLATELREEDGSVTLSLQDLDLVAWGEDLDAAKKALAQDILEYAEEYYQDFQQYSKAPNRKGHLPYVMKALMAKTPKELEDAIQCQSGKN